MPGTVELTAAAPTATTFPIEAVFVPVKLDEGFDFSLFLEDLSFELPLNLMLLRMRQQHPVVVRALRAALEPEPQPWEGWRTAGTLVVFRPLRATPWVEAELARREAERAAPTPRPRSALTHTDPGVQGDVRRPRRRRRGRRAPAVGVERIDELERTVPSELDRHEQLARLERLERAQNDGSALASAFARLDQLERDRAAAEARADERLAAAIAAAEARAAAAIHRFDVSSQLESVRAEHERDLTGELATLREAVERSEAAAGDVARLREAVERHQAASADVAAASDLAALREAVERNQAAAGDIAALREAVGRHEAAAADTAARHDALSGMVAALREAVSRHAEASAGASELAELREAVARHDEAAAQVAELRDVVAELRAQVAEQDRVAGRTGGHDVVEREELARRLDGLAPRDELAALAERLDGLVDRDVLATLAAHDEVVELAARLESLAAGDVDSRLAAEVAELRERLDSREDAGVAQRALSTAEYALQRIPPSIAARATSWPTSVRCVRPSTRSPWRAAVRTSRSCAS